MTTPTTTEPTTGTEAEEAEQTTTEATETPEAGAESGQEGTETPEEGEDTGGRTRGLRARAQEAEAEVERLDALVTEYRRDELARAARQAGMLNPEDFLERHEPDEFLDAETGRLDQAAFDAAMTDLRERRRHLFRGGQRPAADHSQGSSANGTGSSRATSWSDVLKSGKR